MEIEPREYTEEEFYQQAQQRITELESEILGDNPDLEHVSRSLNLPGEDATGVFTYAWRSDNPAVLSSYGKVDLEEVTETVMKAFLAGGMCWWRIFRDLARRPWRLLFPERSDCRSAGCSLHRM